MGDKVVERRFNPSRMKTVAAGKVKTQIINGRVEVYYDWEMIRQSTWKEKIKRMIRSW